MTSANVGRKLSAASMVFTAVAVFLVGVKAGQANEQVAPLTVQAAAGKDLAQQTEQCVGGSMSTDSAQCKQAAAKAAEVKAAPAPAQTTVVTAPRRSDAEVMDLLQRVLEAHPELIPKGTDGKPYTLTDADKAEIVAMVRGEIPTPKDGLPGPKGDKGDPAVVDYDKIVAQVLALVPVPKDGVTPPCMSTAAQCQGAEGKQGPPPAHLGWSVTPAQALAGYSVSCTYDPETNSYPPCTVSSP